MKKFYDESEKIKIEEIGFVQNSQQLNRILFEVSRLIRQNLERISVK